MAESGIPYDLVTAGGTVRFNRWGVDDGSGVLVPAPTIFQLTSVEGLEPEVRTSHRNRPHRPGMRKGKTLFGGLYPVLEGAFVHNSPASQESMRRTLEAALRSMADTPGTLRWQPSDAGGDWRTVEVTLNEKWQISGGLFKTFQFSLATEKPYIFGETLKNVSGQTLSSSAGGGLTFPFTLPLQFAATTTSGSGTFTNDGDIETYPILTIVGPITSPTVFNYTTGLKIVLTGLTVPAGETVNIDTWEEQVFRNGDRFYPVDRYVDITQSTFFPLIPGDNVVGVVGSSTDSAVTRITAAWRDAYV